MYPIAVVGANLTARAAILACAQSGFNDITWVAQERSPLAPALTLPANLTRIVNALGRTEQLSDLAHLPDREQVRFATSGFLLSELPLGEFTKDRYGAPHVNLDYEDLLRVLDLELAPANPQSLEALERSHGAILVCTPADQVTPAATHDLWHAQTHHDAAMGKANITWLANEQTAWQFCTRNHTHFLFSVPVGETLDPAAWHPRLHDAIADAEVIGQFDAANDQVREHWYEGNVTYLGEACYTANVYRREGLALGLEDAWVLSRMLENYEEDVGDGLAEYQKFRRPRARRVARATVDAARQLTLRTPLRRLARNLNTAFSTRFLPEIAMQRIDWFYSYDCIRGFR